MGAEDDGEPEATADSGEVFHPAESGASSPNVSALTLEAEATAVRMANISRLREGLAAAEIRGHAARAAGVHPTANPTAGKSSRCTGCTKSGCSTKTGRKGAGSAPPLAAGMAGPATTAERRHTAGPSAGAAGGTPVKRGPGRPKGSKNKQKKPQGCNAANCRAKKQTANTVRCCSSSVVQAGRADRGDGYDLTAHTTAEPEEAAKLAISLAPPDAIITLEDAGGDAPSIVFCRECWAWHSVDGGPAWLDWVPPRP